MKSHIVRETQAIRNVHIIRTDSFGGTERALTNHLAVTERKFDHIIIGTANALPEVRRAYTAHGKLHLPQKYQYPEYGIDQPTEAIRRIIRRAQGDIMISWQHPTHVIGARTSASLNTPVISYEHSAPDNSSDLARQEMKEIIAASQRGAFNRQLYVSHYAQKTHENIGVSYRNAEVIPIGIDLVTFRRDEKKRQQIRKQLKLSDTDTLIGVVTQDRQEKDFPATLEVTTRLIEKCKREGQTIPHFAIYGIHFSTDNQALVNELERKNISQYVHLCGLVEPEDMPGIYSAMDINFLTSQTETFGLTSVEGMACGVPFIGTEVGEHPQIIGNTGVLLPTRDGEKLSMWKGADRFVEEILNMRRRLSNLDERDRMIREVSARVQKYDRISSAERLGEIVIVEFARGKLPLIA